MHRIRRHRPSPALAAVTVALLAALGGVAWASIPGPEGIIHGCYGKHGGQLRVIDTTAGGKCRHKEAALNWDETGPPGPRGGRGATGPRGAAGPLGAAGASGSAGAQGPSNAYSASETAAFALAGGERDVLSLNLPAGRYVVSASVNVANTDATNEGPETATCVINDVPVSTAEASGTATIPFVSGLDASETVPLDGTWRLSAPETLELSCTQLTAGATSASLAQIDAIQVGALNGS
ncbi:MAG: hypothetical protein ACLP1Q_20565 [Solirubrobacteraceae bacterium]